MTIPSISIIICTWNRCQLLAETLSTLRLQELPIPCEIEVIVVNNNSSDQTAAVVHDFATNWPLGTLHYLHESTQGKQFALNLAVRNALGEIFAFTDDDVILPKDWVANILNVFSDPQLELVGGKTLLLWPNGLEPAWFRANMLAVVAGVDIGDKKLCPPPPDYAPAGTNLIARRSLFTRVGLFSETHYRHMDYEFGIRAARNGAVIQYDPTLVVYTRVPKEILNKNYFRRWYFKLGIAAAAVPTSTPVLLGVPRWIWRQLLEDILTIIFYTLRGRSDPIFDREVRAAQLLGQLSSVWHKKLWPSSHQRWIERWSQKCGVNFG